MNLLRTSRHAAALALAWFVLFLGVAGISPVLHATSLEPLCSVSVAGQGLSHQNPDGQPATPHTLKCALCIGLLAPPTTGSPAIAGVAPLADVPVLQGTGPIAVAVRAPLPARGPPTLS